MYVRAVVVEGGAEAEEQPFYHFFIIHFVFVSLTK